MNHIHGTSARQLELLDFDAEDHDRAPIARRAQAETPRPALRMLRKDVYAELARRRRRAQIAARHLLK